MIERETPVLNINFLPFSSSTGIPDLGVPPIDPLQITALTIQQGRNSPISLKQEFKHILLTGISNTKLVTYKPNLDKYILRTEGITPRVNLAGDYKMTGRILLLPIVGNGRANITMIDLKTVHELIGEPMYHDGETYIRFKEYNIKLIPARVHLHFENLFNGDRLLGNQMNRFMNDNWELIFSELKGGYEETLSYVFKEVTNKLFTKVPMDRIFPRTTTTTTAKVAALSESPSESTTTPAGTEGAVKSDTTAE